MAQKIKIQVNFDFGKIKKGDHILIAVDENSIPLDQFWRRRLKDSAIDQCIQIIVPPNLSEKSDSKNAAAK